MVCKINLKKYFIFTLVFLTLIGCSSKNQSEESSKSQILSLQNSYVSISGTQVTAGQDITVSIQILDDSNSPYLTEGQVTLAIQNGTSTGRFSSVTYAGNGAYSATFTGELAGTSVEVIAQFNGQLLLSTPPKVEVLLGPLSLSKSSISVGTSSLASGLQTLVVLTLKDEGGNPIISSGRTVAFSYSGGTSTGQFSAVVENADGTYSSNLTGKIAGSASSITANIDGQAVTSQAPSLNVIPGSISLAMSSVGGPTSGNVGVTVTLTLTLKDGNGNLNPSGTVNTVGLSKAFVSGDGNFATAIPMGGGVYNIDFTPTVAGSLGILGNVNGSTTSVSYGLWFTISP